MAFDAADLERILKLLSLIQQSVPEVLAFIQNQQAQSGKTTDEILAHAEKTNAEALKIIEDL